jgi:hypothetical protein
MFNAFLPGIGALAGPLIGKIGDLFSNLFHFGGPSAQEKQGRSVWDEFVDSMRAAETEADHMEAAQNVAIGATQDWADAATTLKNRYLALGLSGDEALGDIARMQAATKQGGDAVQKVVDEINAKLTHDTPDAAKAAQDALAAATGDSGLRLGLLNDKIIDFQKQLGQPVTIAVNTADAEAKLAMLAAQKASLDSIIGDNRSVDGSGNNSGGVMSLEEFIRRNGIEDAHRYQDAVLADHDNGHARGGVVYAATGMFIPRGTDTVPAMLTPGEGVVSRRGMGTLGVDGLASLNSGGSPFTALDQRLAALVDAMSQMDRPVNVRVYIGGEEIDARTLTVVQDGLANGKLRVGRRSVTDRIS